MNISQKVSIQIPTYNQQDYIATAVESALMQDYENIEIIIADDYSTDDTSIIIKKFANNPKVKYVRNISNIGRIANYRKTFYEHCTGDWVVNLDGDDYFITNDFISYAISIINNYSTENIVVFQGNHNLKKVKGIFKDYIPINDDAVLIEGSTYFINYYKVQRFKHCATLFKRDEALQLNFYSFNALSCDFNSISKLFLKGKIIISGTKVAEWRQHNNNQSASLNQKLFNSELNSIKDIANFANPFFEKNIILNWEKKMIIYFKSAYIELLIQRSKNITSFKSLVKNFNWNYNYIKQFIKYFIK